MSIIHVTTSDVWGRSHDCLTWCAEHGIVAADTYALYLDTEAMTAEVYQYKRNEQGAVYRMGDGPAMREPFTVPIAHLPDLRPTVTDWREVLRQLADDDHCSLDGGELTEGWHVGVYQSLTEDGLHDLVDTWTRPDHQSPHYQNAMEPNDVDPAVVAILVAAGLIENRSCHWNARSYGLTEAGRRRGVLLRAGVPA